MRILALTKYGSLGASSRVRTYQYRPFLQKAGVDVTISPLLDDAYVTRRYARESVGIGYLLRTYCARVAEVLRARKYDLIWIEKELLPFVPLLAERMLLARRLYVLDYDDAIFHLYDQHRSWIVRALFASKIDQLMRGAALVTAGNAYLAERAIMAGAKKVQIVPSVIDFDRYGPVVAFLEKPFTIGWIGSPGSERLLEGIRGVLSELTADRTTRLVLVGASPRALEGVPHETRQWTLETEVTEIQKFHVGIMPLRDTPWERGKCGYKLIQCMAAGRVVVASPVGANCSIVENGVSGFLATQPDDWLKVLTTLREDFVLCARLGIAGRSVVEGNYSLSVWAPRLVAALRGAAAAA